MRPQWKAVQQLILEHPQNEQLDCLFELLLTEEERQAFAGRLKVFQLLLEGQLSQRQIAAEYGISIATITRCSNYLKNMSAPTLANVQALIL
ncbi:trp operon repressor [Shewanella yunxiaonensis]|uniref:Trp operon repressor n=1 Tax=Shewanella yunxiaonensis TaxID=2829809 RepID=A0ABX7YRJ7_9GAMM|nr:MULTISPECIES: trp operon repressor [Shewanella]MDF0533714.1 trp operon repressor [Shewanella sp. A32]QUN04921.1 trp operon repressor [Shewanella yunxiaonensis]